MAMIQWFPGHMHLTQKAIAERVKNIDVVRPVLIFDTMDALSSPIE